MRREPRTAEPSTVESSAVHMAEPCRAEPSAWLRVEQSMAELSVGRRRETAARGRNRSRAVVEGNRTY